MIHQIMFNRSAIAWTGEGYETVEFNIPYCYSIAGDIVIRDNQVFKVINGVEVPSAINDIPNKIDVRTERYTDRKVW